MLNPNEEPIITANTIQAFGALILAGLLAFGVPMSDDQRLWAISAFAFLSPFVAAWWTRRRSTPTAAPKAEDGTPLVRADTHLPTRAAVEYQGKQTLAATKRSLRP